MQTALFAVALAGATVVAPTRPAPRAQAPRAAAPVTWAIDPVHSDASFKIRHVVSRVTGNIREWSGTIVADPANLSGGSVELTLNMASIDTHNEKRDGHLKSAEFFDVVKFPTATFKSTKVTAKGNDLTILGDLTMKGVTKPVTLTAEFTGAAGEAVAGKQKAGFHASAKINRLDWGVSWNRAAEGGGAVLGDDVDLDFNIEATRQ
jgi:polyisoprenoid-binding protein YceI